MRRRDNSHLRSAGVEHDFGFLTIEQAGQCAQTCIDNAYRLIGAGKLLFENEFIELAIFSVCTAIEEGGKALLLVEYQDDKAGGRKDAVNILKRAFYNHNLKLESAITASEIDQQLADELKKYGSEHKEPKNAIHRIVKILENISIPNISPKVKSTFDLRNSMIYTEFKDGQILAPWDRVHKSQFDHLLDIAEKILARADLELSISDVCFQRGKSRRQFVEFMLAELPTIVDMMRKRRGGNSH